ncbi:MAG: PEGA domain-containing protein [Proteobacteria bacterium]|jgi:hypothetical protein|nr:PEGA domain-containing protein [Pseudomonadota bacterium]
MKKILSTLLISATVLTVSGCASMFGDNTRTVNINSNPSGADVYINGVNRGSTPMALNLPTYFYGGASITLKKSGYKDTGIFIDAKFQPVGLWNILTFPIGFGVDAATGDLLKVDPAALNTVVNLSKSS